MQSSNLVLWLGLLSGLPVNFLGHFLTKNKNDAKIDCDIYRLFQEEGAKLKEGIKSF
jgi:hypothetical protein